MRFIPTDAQLADLPLFMDVKRDVASKIQSEAADEGKMADTKNLEKLKLEQLMGAISYERFMNNDEF